MSFDPDLEGLFSLVIQSPHTHCAFCHDDNGLKLQNCIDPQLNASLYQSCHVQGVCLHSNTALTKMVFMSLLL